MVKILAIILLALMLLVGRDRGLQDTAERYFSTPLFDE